MEITFREALPKDAEKILAYLNKVKDESDFLVVEDLDVDVIKYQQTLVYLYESKKQFLMLAWLEDEIIGMVNINGQFEDKRQHIGELGISVLKEFWQQKIGSYLMEEMLAWFHEESELVRLELYVNERNLPAIGLYQKFGFEIEGRLRKALQVDEDEYVDAVVMSIVK